MANYADTITDKQLAQMEKHIAEIYKDAYEGVSKSWRQYIKGYDEIIDGKKIHHKGLKERYAEEYKAFQEGKYTEQQFNTWYMAQVGRGKKWQALRNDMAKKMTQTNQIATAYVNDKTPGIYTLNANFAAYEIEQGTGIAFNLVNEQAVRRLMQGENHTEFRTLSVNPVRDYNWNTEKIQNALLSGILQGNSIEKLTDRFLEVMGMNERAAIRNARTAVTSAQNGGRQSTFNRAKAMGIDMKKEWIATNDSRTRDSHRELDGVRVENENHFPNGCMYPGDPGGEPSEVYNCRCTMRAILPRYNAAKRTSKTEESYKKWLADKKATKINENAQNQFTFAPAHDIKEVKTRISEALGIASDKIALGRMGLELANEYLDGIETFTHEFPQIKGIYTGFDTKTGGGGNRIVYGVNKISGKGRKEAGEIVYDCTFELALKSPKDVQEMMGFYEHGVKTKQSYDGSGPKTTAMHELTHGLDYAIKMRENGYFVDGKLQTTIKSDEWNRWASTASTNIVKETKKQVFGAEYGKEVYAGTSYLGSYAQTNNCEMMAETISYELSGKTNPYGAKMLKILKDRVKEAFK